MSGRSCSVACALFFARDLVALEEAADRAVAEDQTLVGQLATQFLQRDVRSLLQQGQDRRTIRLDPSRTPVSAQRLRLRIALLAFQFAPTADAGGADTEPLRRLAMRQTCGNCRQNPNPKINRKRFRHACRLHPADSLNQIRADLGIPSDSFRWANALGAE